MTHVPPEGPLDARIAIVGEAPGAFEEVKHRPFVGPAGQLLDRLLAQAGILRNQVYLTNVMKVRPPKNDFSTFWLDGKQTQPTEQLAEGIEELIVELASLSNLRVIIALGRQPMFILTGMEGISKWRGSALETREKSKVFDVVYDIIEEGHQKHDLENYHEPQSVKVRRFNRTVLPTFHPSFCLRQWGVIPLVVHDLKRAKGLVTAMPKEPKELIPYPTEREINLLLERLTDLKCDVSVDIECANAIISRISLTDSSKYGVSIPFVNIETDILIKGQEWIWDSLRDLLPTAPIIGQNFSFDMAWLWKKQGIDIQNLIHDTMIAQHVILPGLLSFLKPLSLAMLTSLYTEEPYYKDEGKILEGRKPPDVQYGIYSARDAAVTFEVYQEQLTAPMFKKQRETFEFEMALVRGPIKHMMRTGIQVDIGMKEALRERAQKELECLELLVSIELGYSVNLRSPKQLQTLLYTDMNLKGGVSKSTGEENLKILQAKYPGLDVLNYILQHRGIEQVYKNILSAQADDDHRMRCSYSPTTTTGRFKSSKNPFRSGTNLQNIPRDKRIRAMFIPDSGNVLIECDLEQAELRAVAYLANEPNLIHLLEEDGVDIHVEMAKGIFQKDEISKEERQLGKRIVHAGNYLISARGLVRACRIEMGLDIKESHAKGLLRNYFLQFPMIKLWHKEIETTLGRCQRTLVTPFGRERQFFERWGAELFRKATAYLPQSTIADLLNKIMLKWEADHTIGCLLLQLHDAFYIQVQDGWMENALMELKETFKFPLTIRDREVIIPVSFKVSRCWGGEEIRK